MTHSKTDAGDGFWGDVTIGLLVGIVTIGSSVFLVTLVEAPIGPTIEAVPLFVFNTTTAMIALALLVRNNRLGYPVATLTGVLVLIALGLIGTQTVGNTQVGANPIGPLAYAGLAVLTIGVSVAGWRTERRRVRVANRSVE